VNTRRPNQLTDTDVNDFRYGRTTVGALAKKYRAGGGMIHGWLWQHGIRDFHRGRRMMLGQRTSVQPLPCPDKL